MTRDLLIAGLFLAVGGFFALHCSAASRREFRAGVARGLYSDYPRRTQPVSFWTIMAGNVFAVLLGLVFLSLGFFQLYLLFG